MTKNITRIPICDGVTFHSIGEKRFKTGRLTAAMLLPLMFVRMGVGFTETLYRLALLLAAANTAVMFFL